MSGGHKNPGSFFNPINLAGDALTGGLFNPARAIKANMKPPSAPVPGAPPVLTPPPTPADANPFLTAGQRAKKLSALKMGMASTITANPMLANTSNLMPGLKAKLGQ